MNDSVSKTEARERESNEKRETKPSSLSVLERDNGETRFRFRTATSLSNQNKEIHFSARIKISPTKGGGKNVKKTYLQSCLLQRDQSPGRAFAGFVHLPVRPLPDLFELFVALVDRGRVTHDGLNFFFRYIREYKRFVIL